MKNDTPLFERYREVYDFFNLVKKVGLFDKEKDLDNEYYHHKNKGCKLVPITKRLDRNGINQFYIHKYQECKTHGVNVCDCGWQVGYHYGTCSKKLPKPKKIIKDYGRGYCTIKNCNKPVIALGLCTQHYTKHNRNLLKTLTKLKNI